jgi:transcription elongation factor GreA
MSTGDQVLLTQEEKHRLQAELDELVHVKRPDIAHKIGRAASDGDLSENGAYHHAKEQQGHLEGRINELEYLLRNAVVVQPNVDTVGIGNTVNIKDESGKARTYQVVSKHSAKPSEGLISDESPLGKALLGKSAGDTVQYATPSGELKSVKIERVA